MRVTRISRKQRSETVIAEGFPATVSLNPHRRSVGFQVFHKGPGGGALEVELTVEEIERLYESARHVRNGEATEM